MGESFGEPSRIDSGCDESSDSSAYAPAPIAAAPPSAAAPIRNSRRLGLTASPSRTVPWPRRSGSSPSLEHRRALLGEGARTLLRVLAREHLPPDGVLVLHRV